MASLIARNTDLTGQLTAGPDRERRAADANKALEASLAQARSELDAGAEAARLAAARREALEALVASLRSDAADQQARLDTATQQSADRQAELDAAAQIDRRSRPPSSPRRWRWPTSRPASSRPPKASAPSSAQQLEAAGRLAAERSKQIDDAEAARLVEAAAAEALREKLEDSDAELTAMTLSLEAERKRAEETLTLLAAAEAPRSGARRRPDHGADRGGEARGRAGAGQRAPRRAEGDLRRGPAPGRAPQPADRPAAPAAQPLQGLLDTAEAKDVAAQVQIDKLGANLNAALARVAIEEKRRGRARGRGERAAGRRGQGPRPATARSSSDRCARSSASARACRWSATASSSPPRCSSRPGSATLGAAGQAQVARVAQVIREIADQIPPEINWVLRVDGHTDKTPVSADSPFADNWELSEARALSVVRYMTQVQGLPAGAPRRHRLRRVPAHRPRRQPRGAGAATAASSSSSPSASDPAARRRRPRGCCRRLAEAPRRRHACPTVPPAARRATCAGVSVSRSPTSARAQAGGTNASGNPTLTDMGASFAIATGGVRRRSLSARRRTQARSGCAWWMM